MAPSRRPPVPSPTTGPTTTGPEARHDLQEAAGELLSAMSLVRRTAHRTAGRPALLSGLTASQIELVGLLRRAPGLSVAEAAEQLHLAPNTVSTLIGQLAEAGVVVRVADPTDRRIARLDLEPTARQKVSEWSDRRAEALARAMTTLSPEDQRVLTRAAPVLVQVADALERLGPQ